ncbi:590_t:CDS:1, partial [Diversispora eburnea]
MKKESKFTFPPETEIKKVLQRGSKPNFRRVNIGLTPNATPLERAKHDLCKTILRYKHDNNLRTEDIAQKLGLNLVKTEYILYSHIDKLTFEELLGYANNLYLPYQ